MKIFFELVLTDHDESCGYTEKVLAKTYNKKQLDDIAKKNVNVVVRTVSTLDIKQTLNRDDLQAIKSQLQ